MPAISRHQDAGPGSASAIANENVRLVVRVKGFANVDMLLAVPIDKDDLAREAHALPLPGDCRTNRMISRDGVAKFLAVEDCFE